MAETATKDHNVKHRTDTIASCMEALYQEDKAIKAALEEHVTPHREEKTAIKKRLREDLNLTTPVINARYATYKLERQAQDQDDETTLDLLKELFEITPVGTQVSMMDALDGGAKKK